jgi:hypothetical protein
MAGFRSVADMSEVIAAGQFDIASLRKVPGQGSIIGWWVDTSMGAGNPPANYYIGTPLEASRLNPMRGISHGSAVSPAYKFVTDISLTGNIAGLVGAYRLLDYLLIYPFVDLDDTSDQLMDNAVELNRYEDGEGVQAMMVCVAPTLGFGTFTFDYIDSDGNQQTSPLQSWHSNGGLIGSLLNSQSGLADRGWPFLRTASGTRGIRRIVSYTNVAPNGGLGCLVLVKPLTEITIRELNTPVEVNFMRDRFVGPRVHDDAFLGLIINCGGTVVNGTLTGFVRYAWG